MMKIEELEDYNVAKSMPMVHSSLLAVQERSDRNSHRSEEYQKQLRGPLGSIVENAPIRENPIVEKIEEEKKIEEGQNVVPEE